jgi:hypothetical protein
MDGRRPRPIRRLGDVVPRPDVAVDGDRHGAVGGPRGRSTGQATVHRATHDVLRRRCPHGPIIGTVEGHRVVSSIPLGASRTAACPLGEDAGTATSGIGLRPAARWRPSPRAARNLRRDGHTVNTPRSLRSRHSHTFTDSHTLRATAGRSAAGPPTRRRRRATAASSPRPRAACRPDRLAGADRRSVDPRARSRQPSPAVMRAPRRAGHEGRDITRRRRPTTVRSASTDPADLRAPSPRAPPMCDHGRAPPSGRLQQPRSIAPCCRQFRCTCSQRVRSDPRADRRDSASRRPRERPPT